VRMSGICAAPMSLVIPLGMPPLFSAANNILKSYLYKSASSNILASLSSLSSCFLCIQANHLIITNPAIIIALLQITPDSVIDFMAGRMLSIDYTFSSCLLVNAGSSSTFSPLSRWIFLRTSRAAHMPLNKAFSYSGLSSSSIK